MLNWLALAALAMMALFASYDPGSAQVSDETAYVGAETCKKCHGFAYSGDQYGTWLTTRHAKAVGTLATEKAATLAAERGEGDPRQNIKCLKCHVTGLRLGAEQLGDGFDHKNGVQCESCHGSGGKHVRIRTEEANKNSIDFSDPKRPRQELYAEEINLKPSERVCRGCHNEESPAYTEEFNCAEKLVKILHLDPRKKRKPAQAIQEVCTNGPE